MATKFLKPAPGMQIPDLALGDFLPEEGRLVEMNSYWTHRIRDKDVIEVEPKEAQTE